MHTRTCSIVFLQNDLLSCELNSFVMETGYAFWSFRLHYYSKALVMKLNECKMIGLTPNINVWVRKAFLKLKKWFRLYVVILQ